MKTWENIISEKPDYDEVFIRSLHAKDKDFLLRIWFDKKLKKYIMDIERYGRFEGRFIGNSIGLYPLPISNLFMVDIFRDHLPEICFAIGAFDTGDYHL